MRPVQIVRLSICAAMVTILAASLSSCTADGGSGAVIQTNSSTSDVSSSSYTASLADSEFEYNYLLLKYFYYEADAELATSSYYAEYAGRSAYAGKEYADTRYMYSQMSDLFTRYFTPAYYNYIMTLLTQSESETNIGMKVDTSLKVKLVYPNGSAENAGIQKGDSVISVDSIAISSYQAYERLVDSSTATTFSIEFQRGDSAFTVSLQKTELLLPTVYLDSIKGIPVITVTEFTDSTSDPKGTDHEFERALSETEGATATVLDLRGNGGGSVDKCVAMAEMLLPKNDTAITMISTDLDSVKMKQVMDTTYEIASSTGIGKGRYYVLLLDTGSASCTEMFAAAITSNLQSPIVGMTSYGKGIGQYYMTTYAGGIAGITSLHILDKNGKSYHTYGILPDYEISDPDAALAKAVELAKGATVKRTAGYGTQVLSNWTGEKYQMKGASGAIVPSFDKKGMYKLRGHTQLPLSK
jgi:C-terminal peptidase prc